MSFMSLVTSLTLRRILEGLVHVLVFHKKFALLQDQVRSLSNIGRSIKEDEETDRWGNLSP